MKKVDLVLAAFIVLIAGCGSGDNSDSSSLSGNSNTSANNIYKITPATYTLNGSMPPSCPNAYHVATTKAVKEDDIGVQICTWLCASYEGASPVEVKLFFCNEGKIQHGILMTQQHQQLFGSVTIKNDDSCI